MERRRRRIRGRYFDDLSAEEQVLYAIEHWNEIWTPFNAEVEYGMSIDSCEYRDFYFIPGILEEVKGTACEQYTPEICHGYLAFEYGF